MSLDPSNSSSLEQLAFGKELKVSYNLAVRACHNEQINLVVSADFHTCQPTFVQKSDIGGQLKYRTFKTKLYRCTACVSEFVVAECLLDH